MTEGCCEVAAAVAAADEVVVAAAAEMESLVLSRNLQAAVGCGAAVWGLSSLVFRRRWTRSRYCYRRHQAQGSQTASHTWVSARVAH